MIDRRTMLAGSAALAAASLGPRMAFARTAGEKRLLVLVMRGATDGLALAAPLADPAFRAARAKWLDTYADAPKLDGTFALHPALAETGRLYGEGDALLVHAVATSYRERSHFDAQNLLETGGMRPFERRDGFLNRFLGLLEGSESPAIALASALPLALRGSNPASTYAPTTLPKASDALLDRLPDLYAGDPQLAGLWQQARQTEAIADASDMDSLGRARDAGTLAARMLADPQGARVVMMDLAGWDSHANQLGMLQRRFTQFDGLMAAFRAGIGPVWEDTLVLVVTEFGRTVAINGTNGTDHGTGSAALLLGGLVKGGRVLADWPGLASGQLYEGRDLKPTMSLEALNSGALASHFELDAEKVMRALYPGRTDRPVEGLIA
ncbi:DUF1501 domain-containing protein [Qipengyuania gelatinilytica]|uniref:DUF1501 domain-containing protein n=1 Tax=Qipengyuania gelatinilytica TaxID=2867231 RepID=A0ABX9A9A7_9SPHN|nr:DUF1501 domain-containing protein [Qipengyuania gelatinilytica]QZD95838.1 DUF1501 domain-containing protein [Qipengyuania gelatinilytica]